MRLLFITPNIPQPSSSGSAIIAYNYIKQLSLHHEVDLISFGTTNDVNSNDIFRWCANVTLFDKPTRAVVLLKMGLGVISDLPLPVSHYRSLQMDRYFHAHYATHRYDVVMCQLIEMAQYSAPVEIAPSLLLMEDPLIIKYQRQSPWRNTIIGRMITKYEISRLTRYEKRVVPRFDRTILINPLDLHAYSAIVPQAKLECVPYGIDTSAYTPVALEQRSRGMILISGNMNHPANVDAVDYFCSDIYPYIRQRVPFASLWLVGANPTERVVRWAKDESIHVTGFVPDMSVYIQKAMVSACPVTLGFGSRTKVLEALACGTPVVTTTAANTGIGATPDRDLYTADNAHEFTERVISLLNGECWEELAANGRRFVVEQRSWDVCVSRMETILQDVVMQRRATNHGK